jgi:hypothetical protein
MKTLRKKGRVVDLNPDRRDLIQALNRYFKAPFFRLSHNVLTRAGLDRCCSFALCSWPGPSGDRWR